MITRLHVTALLVSLCFHVIGFNSLASAATIVTGDVTANLLGTKFVDNAAVGGGDQTIHESVGGTDIIRTLDFNGDGLINDTGTSGTLTIGGFGFATLNNASFNDATSVALTFTYLGADTVIGGGDDVLIGSETVGYTFVANGEYYVNFASTLAAVIDGQAQKIAINVKPIDLNGVLQESISFKTGSVPFDALANSAKLSLSGSFVPAGGPTPEWNIDAAGNWNTAANWTSSPAVPGVGGLAGGAVVLGSAITADRTITLNVNAQQSTVTFNNTNSYTISDGGGANTLALSGTATINTSTGSHTIDAVVTGSAGLTKSGAGSLTLADTNTYTGTTKLLGGTLDVSANTNLGNAANAVEFNGGTLRINGASFTSTSRAVTMTGAGTLNVADAANSVNFTGAMTGSGNLVKAGDGGAQLSNAATYDGLISVNDGTLVVKSNGGLGSVAGVTQIGANGGTVVLDGSGGSLTISENFQRLLARFTAVPEAHIRNVAGNNTISGTIEAGGGAFGNARFENTANATTLTLNNKIFYTDEDTGFNFVFEGTGNFRVGDVATPNSGKIVGNDANVVVNLTDSTDKVTIATAFASGDTSNATGSYWGGNTTIQSGTLEVLDSALGNDGELQSRRITVQSGARFDIAAFGVYNSQVTDIGPDLTAFTVDDIGQIFAGAGTINTGAGVLTIFEDSRVAPGDSAGTLNVTGNVRFNMTQANANGGLDYELGSTTALGGPTNDLLAVSGSLDLDRSGTGQYNLNITPVNGNLAAGTYTLMTGTTAGSSATGANFAITLLNPQGTVLNSRQDNSSAVTVNPTNVTVNFTAAQSYNWTGSTNGTWDVGTTSNWSSSDNRFFDLDTVSFGNGTGQTTVNIVGPVTPGGVTFNNTTDIYTITGGGIEGSGALNLSAGARVVLANTGNAYTGGTNIATGAMLTLGDGTNSNGQLADSSSVANSGTLAFNRLGYGFFTQTISGSGVVRVESGYTDLSGANTYIGGSIVNGGTLRLRNPSAAGTGGITVNNGGVVETGYFNNQSFTKSVTLNNGATLSVTNPTDSGVAAANSGQITWTSPITLGGTGGRVSTTAGDGIVPGMTVAGGIVGTGDLTLSPATSRLLVVNSAISHSGNTAIAGGGRVALEGSTAINSPTIELKDNSTLDVTATTSGVLALSSKTLKGAGTVAGNVTTTGSSLIRVGGIAAGSPFVQSGLQLHYDAAKDVAGNNTWEDLATNAGLVNVVFADGAASTVPASDGTLQSLTAAYNVGSVGPALSGSSDFGYFDTRAQSSGTFEVVFNVSNTSAGNEQVLVDIGGTRGLALTLDGSTLKAGVNGDAAFTTGFTTSLATGWHHAVMVVTDTDPNDGLNDGFALYVNNALVGSSNTVDIDDYAGANQWGFGGPADSGAVVLNPANGTPDASASLVAPIDYHGDIALVRYYQAALNAGDVNQNYQSLSNPVPFVGVDTLGVNGNLTLNSTSTLEIDIFNTTVGNDLLSITGNLIAAGTLDINLAGTVNLGDSFDVLNFAAASGSFNSISLPSLGGGLSWDTSALLTTGILSVVTGGTPGDFDNDGDVDGRDFLLWQRGGSPTPFSSSDLMAWQTAYNGGLLVANSTAVPEPTSLALLLAVGLVLTQCRQRI